MWKRDQQQKSTSDTQQSQIQPAAPAAPQSPPAGEPSSSHQPGATMPGAVSAPAGASLLIKGQISASEDLVWSGRIEGKVSLPEHMLTIGRQAAVSAEIVARTLIVEGSVTGDVMARERFEIRTGGRMMGNVVCPNVIMGEGSEFTGGVDMRRKGGTTDGLSVEVERRGKPSAV